MIGERNAHFRPNILFQSQRQRSGCFTAGRFDPPDSNAEKDSQQVVVLCVGTDRATGDCLGPLVGHQLMTSSYYKVFGTLSQPVHAGNLTQTMAEIYRSFREPFVIAIDACLGSADHVGYVTVSSMPLFPGQGVDKELPPVGDISITGIVNFTSETNFNTIQTTRLHTVMELSSYIACGVEDSVRYFAKHAATT